MTVKTYRAKSAQVAGEPWHGRVEFLEPPDAEQLYRLTHRDRVLVLGFGAIYVRRDPSRQPVVRRAALTLDTFVAHKADYTLVRHDGGVRRALDEFIAAEGRINCAGDDDPRCLPLHIFAVDRDWASLETSRGRAAFDSRHGGPRSRLDSASARWDRADRRAFHGTPILTVAGRALAPGMHWDVASDRRRVRLYTTKVIWEIARDRGYLNVYPDGYVRPGGGVRRVWPRQ